MADRIKPDKAYKNLDFLNSPAGRTIRMMCEVEEPRQRFAAQGVRDTIAVFGSARSMPLAEAREQLAQAQRELERARDREKAVLQVEVERAQRLVRLSRYYDDGRELSRRLTAWDIARKGPRRYTIATGGGPGMMAAANRGAADVPGGRSIGLGISLPFEDALNPWVTPSLAFEFHYFFTRKYWFTYLAKAMVVLPGGFGTMDELFETMTLRQTGKIKKPMPTVLFGSDYWNAVMDIRAMVEWGTISERDLLLYHITDSVDDAFDYLVAALERAEAQEIP